MPVKRFSLVGYVYRYFYRPVLEVCRWCRQTHLARVEEIIHGLSDIVEVIDSFLKLGHDEKV